MDVLDLEFEYKVINQTKIPNDFIANMNFVLSSKNYAKCHFKSDV